MKLDRAVFLDFDGVLFDTVKEAYAVCLFATNKIRKDKDLDFESEDFKIFKKYRYLIGPAWNYFYLLKAIEEIKDMGRISLERRYWSYINKADASDYKAFERDFFESREHLKRNHERFWFGLNTPYNFFSSLSGLIKRHPDNFFIITTKDRATVLKLLEINGQDFNMENIYDSDTFDRFRTKSSLIKNIMHVRSIEDAVFIDDNRFHLSDCRGLSGLRILQSQWGYISPSDSACREDEILSQIRELLEGV